MTDAVAILLAAAVGLITGAIGILGTYAGAIRLARRNNRSLAGMRLREAFIRELSLLQHPEGRGIAEIPHILKIAFEKHQMAVNEFRFFLTGDELNAFNKAWKEYGDYPDFNKYIVLPTTAEKDIQKAIERINAILEFTK
ncbi:MAG TPA: hypothetical protein VJ440_13995 [Candidatus Brocadiaceae bacterium]|nr:hypothetical protein [Candidatus Brocadiaceae bacterium]